MARMSLEQATEIHHRLLVFDGHNDTPVKRIARGEALSQWMHANPADHMDVPRMQEGSFDGGVFIVGNGVRANLWVTLEQTLAQAEAHPEVLQIARSARDVEAAHQAGRIAVWMGVEGAGRWLNGNLDTARLLYRLGVRLLGITHGEGGEEAHYLQGEPSPTGGCSATDRDNARRQAQGLTEFGRQVLRLSNELGLVTDLAHINDHAFYEVLEQSSLPVTMSHTAAFSLCQHWRCMTDDQIRALASAGGVVGITFVPGFVDKENPTMERVADHICHVVDLVGIDHVGIGSDFDGLPDHVVPIVPDVAQLPRLTQTLLERGFDERELAQVWGSNFLRLIRQTTDGDIDAS